MDPITFSIIRHRLFRVVEEAVITLKHVSGTAITNEGHDLMVSLYRADGSLLMGGVGFLHHLTSAAEACKAIIRRFEGQIEEGDVFMLNDPYTAAQGRFQPRHEFACGEGLGDVVVGARFESGHLSRHVLARRQHQHRGQALFADMRQHLEAVAIRKAEIKDHQIRLLTCELALRFGAGRRFDERIPLLRQARAQEAADLRFVVDDENTGRPRRRHGRISRQR